MKDSGRRLVVLTVGALILFSGGAAGRSSAARPSARAAQSGSIRLLARGGRRPAAARVRARRQGRRKRHDLLERPVRLLDHRRASSGPRATTATPTSSSPGIVGPGKPATCVGGGDTDLYLDPGNALYFSDLQGLTNISNSVSTDGGATWSTNCAGAPNTPDDRMWFAGTGTLAGGNLNLYQDYDAVDSSR